MLMTTLMLAQAAAAAAASPAPAPGQAPTAKVECRLITEAGSRIPTKVCRLDKEWELLAKDMQDDLNRSTNRRSNPGNRPGG
jgi:hypothetical protein